jgi:hypothetical protein
MFDGRLTDRGFLNEIAREFGRGPRTGNLEKSIGRLRTKLASLEQNRQRVLDSYFEGIIDKDERNLRLSTINRDIRVNQSLLMQDRPVADITAESLAEVFSVFDSWSFLERNEKRRILSTLTADIRVSNYQVSELGLNPAIFGRNEVSLTAAVYLVATPPLYLPINIDLRP